MGIFSEQEQQRVSAAVEAAERFTSGEIRVCIEKTCSEPVLDRAANYFKKLDMHKTAKRNGVLIYVATDDHQFAIIGDEGINKLVPHDFWNSTKDAMLSRFKDHDLVGGIVTGVKLAGEQLQTFFPYHDSDINELPNDISFMDGK
ncbi:TPM domain-containing protein [Daejeonella lutea]|uniref:TLP18.3, Psb32 and MOLO-1 founding protein of phosphatase n=1 Tax=Daejeonella lutea TaxID=572036 RepID=A0A1T5FET1_9SPHI|nr:TPM domain-containing protein [Daejeonella lutea]SKB94680.1 TLP18.3, Psb32 and MOLO-1 founding protein of phosphatase [Daejeonella lutea]